MASNGGLVAQPLTPTQSYNWVLLIELCVCGILAIFFYGYLDRLFATIISYLLRWYTWRAFRAYIDIKSLQFSLLAGRIFFKDVTYHAQNVSLQVHSGYITWNYWIRKVREAEVYELREGTPKGGYSDSRSTSGSNHSDYAGREEDGRQLGQANRALPCRLHVRVEGVQAFIYNRSPAYDMIINNFKQSDDKTSPSSTPRKEEAEDADRESAKQGRFVRLKEQLKTLFTDFESNKMQQSEKDSGLYQHRAETIERPKLPAFLRIFPIQVDCKVIGAVLGNENTRSVITAKVKSASGVLDAGQAGPLDVYRQIFDFHVEDIVAHMRPNQDYIEPQLAAAVRLKNEAAFHPNPSTHKRQKWLRWPRFLRSSSSDTSSSLRTASFEADRKITVPLMPADDSAAGRWRGLSRYMEDSFNNEHEEWTPIEYARSSLLADVPAVDFNFYWDTPGKVRKVANLPDGMRDDKDINGTICPGYGMTIGVHGGTVNYGPWTDRQRVNFQNIFFSPSYSDAVPGQPLKSGYTRVNTVFKLFLTIEADLVLRVPVREPSKDWKWKGESEVIIGKTTKVRHKDANDKKKRTFWRNRNKTTTGPTVRPFGWLDVKVVKDTSISLSMDMVARPTGYSMKLGGDIKAVEILSSVNHGLLGKLGPTTLDCDLPMPKRWNELRQWKFKILNNGLELFILRDHLFLFIDLIADWSSGPPPEYFTFVPFKYLLDFEFQNIKLYLNTNDSNIIDNPTDLDDNNFLVLAGRQVTGNVEIPLVNYRPLRNEIFFSIAAKGLELDLCLNSRNTVATFTGNQPIAKVEEVTLKGSHAYFAETSPENTDRLTFFIHGRKVNLRFFGFVIAHLIQLKENYFGDYLHFKTMEEFQGISHDGTAITKEDDRAAKSNKSNDLDVILSISVDDASAQLPANIYDASDNVVADVAFAAVDLRITNYYMDLQVDISPVSISHHHHEAELAGPSTVGSRTELYIESVALTGHRLFGLPPLEPTYVCNWDIAVGSILGECSTLFLEKLIRSIRCLVFTLDDDENATPLMLPPIIHDITFLRLSTQIIKVAILTDNDALVFETDPVTVQFNDWADASFSERLKVEVPSLSLSCFNTHHGVRVRHSDSIRLYADTSALIKTAVSVRMLRRKYAFSMERSKQQDHLVREDQRTNRAQFLVVDTSVDRRMPPLESFPPPALVFPGIPNPVAGPVHADHIKTAPSFSSSASQATSVSTQRSVLRRRTSRTSIKASLRSSGANDSYSRDSIQVPDPSLISSPVNRGSSRLVREKNIQSPSIALGSRLVAPKFKSSTIIPDPEQLPDLPPQHVPKSTDVIVPDFNDVLQRKFDESLEHTSVIISVEPGIQAFFKPHAIEVSARIIQALLPKRPEDILDNFQMQVISGLLGKEKKQAGKGKVVDIALRIPSVSIRFLNPFSNEAQRGQPLSVDQYNLSVSGLALTGRLSAVPTNRKQSDVSLLHCALDSLGFSVRELLDRDPSNHLSFETRIEDLLLWLASTETNSIHATVRTVQVNTASDKVHSLAAVLRRTANIAERYAERFIKIFADHSHRLEYLLYKLTTQDDEVAGPPFLTRTSYSQRAAPHHIRGQDSWKIISRFRYIMQSYSDAARRELKRACQKMDFELPGDAASVVLTNWDAWGAREETQIRESFAFRRLYPPALISDEVIRDTKPLKVSFRSWNVGCAFDPGPHQTKLDIKEPFMDLEILPPEDLTGLMQSDGKPHSREKITVHANAERFEILIDWHVTQLVESILRAFLEPSSSAYRLQTPVINDKSAEAASKLGLETQPRDIHVVLSVGDAIARVNTINLRGLAASHGLKMSIVVSDDAKDKGGLAASVLLHAETSRSEFHAHDQLLLHAKASKPSIYVAKHSTAYENSITNTVNATASTQKIHIEIQEEILGVIEVIDRVVRDEVAYFDKHFSDLIQKTTSKTGVSEASQDSLDLNVALLMDSYHIDIALLQSLVYTVSGRLGRLSIRPGMRGLAFELDFDLGEHYHNLISHAHEGLHVISALRLPPINGQVKVQQTNDALLLKMTMLVETIVLEGGAVHGLLNTLRRPEVAKTFKAVQADVQTIKQRVKSIYPEAESEAPRRVATEDRKLVFDIAGTLEGLRIKADAPGQSANAQGASLVLGLDTVQIKAFNSQGEGQSTMPLPEIRGRLKKVYVALALKTGEEEMPCGHLSLRAWGDCTARDSRNGPKRKYRARVDAIQVKLFAETASAMVDVLNHLQDRLKELDLSRERRYLQKLRPPARKNSLFLNEAAYTEASMMSSGLFTSAIEFSIHDVQVCWIVGNSVAPLKGYKTHDLVLSIRLIDLRSTSESSSTLTIEDVLLQLVPASRDKRRRYPNSALLPYTEFNVRYVASEVDRKLSFQAAGQALDLQLEPKFIIPTSTLQRSINLAVNKFREASASWDLIPTATGDQRRNLFGDKRLSSLLVDVDFQGAVVHLRSHSDDKDISRKGRYGQFVDDASSGAIFKSPGLAVKIEYKDDGSDSAFNAEIMINASSNSFSPFVVPLILEISESVKIVVAETDKNPLPAPDVKLSQSFLADENLLSADPTEILGGTSLNLGLRIRSQEFSLSCQPYARVAASARLEEIYITANNIKSAENDVGQFFAVSAAFQKLEASVQHIYSRQSTFSFEAESIVLSMMNSKHLSGTAGISAILKIYPTKTQINAKQLNDFLVFREIWLPPEIRKSMSQDPASPVPETQEYLVQRYQQVAAAAAFPWNATFAIERMIVELDLGQSIGKSSLVLADFWASSRKASDWEQNLCIGIGKLAIESTGRMSGFVDLAGFNVRTMIAWPDRETSRKQTPSIQASAGFERLRVKAAFDYQALAVADITDFTFLMYNVREESEASKDRLVAILNGGEIQIFCTSTTAAQALAIYQAFERLIQDNHLAYTQNIKEIEKHMRRRSSLISSRPDPHTMVSAKEHKVDDDEANLPISLYTHVVVALKAIHVGAFPGSFSDSQVLLLEASDVRARFAVMIDEGRVHSGLGMTLGQLSVALAAVSTASTPRPLNEITVDDVLQTVGTAKGGVILRVPKVVAGMRTWQSPGSYDIDFVFRSSFEGKVDVGWNYARIGFIRNMYNNHTKTLAARLGKPLPESAVKITTPRKGGGEKAKLKKLRHDREQGQDEDSIHELDDEIAEEEKITAVVNVPQSRYKYHAREPPVIDTPQLRDMGEATPPLEWIGLHRDRLPNVVHQIIIVGLLGVAREVEDAYGRILGRS